MNIKKGSINNAISRFLVLSLILGLMMVMGVSAATINVPGDYPTIQEAIDAAEPNDIVEVQDSETYDEGILINGKNNLIVRAAAGETPKINSPVQGIQLMYCTDVTVEGFDVTSQDHGLRLFCDVFDSTIRNNYIHDIGSELFQTGSSWDHSTGCPRSKFDTTGYNTITGNLIENNRFENANGRAMEFYTGSNNIIRGNKFHYSDDFIFWEYFDNPPHVFDNIVENNTFYGFGDGDGTGYNTNGVKLAGTHQIIRYNIIFDNDRYGISIGGDNHEIYHNTIVHNGGYNNYINSVAGSNDAGGIAVYYDSSNIIVRDNIVANAMDYGLLKR
ncbi:MAG: right-handed parallel beta-helix repeat-containing protein, partial [Nanoarchaeota archaeon]|nr:right-handed parallel beta-helix repeat-containing protein [Nanoarchaeota archaeon]